MLKRPDEKQDRSAASRSPFLAEVDKRASGGKARSSRAVRRMLLALSFALVVALPTILATTYYALIASDQFAVEARFAIRGASAASTPDLSGLLAGTSQSTVGDAYIVMDFVRSRQVLDKIAHEVDYKKMFSHPNADFLARLDLTLATEDVVKYWRRMVGVGFDTTSQIVSIKVRAFTPEDALALARVVLKQSEGLINDLSARSRSDAVSTAEQEVARVEERLTRSRLALEAFRNTRQELDPRKKAESRQQIIETLQGELTNARARLTLMRQQMSSTAPTVVYQTGVIRALEAQIEEERGRIGKVDEAGKGRDENIGGLISDYEALAIEREFAEKAYLSALSSLERARFDASRQQRYLATIVSPTLPDDAQFPKRILNVAIVLALSLSLWALGSLIALAIRDHVT